MKIIRECKEGVLWLSIFLSPLITGLIISLFLFVDGYNLLAFGVIAVSILSGIALAEWVRKHYGCSNYLSALFHHKEE